MSVFKVQLVSPTLGAGYATDPSVTSGVSAQKTIELNGPNLTRRRHYDGETFTESNYYKRYCPISEGGNMPNDSAYLTLVSDDGQIWDDHNKSANKFTVVHHLRLTAGTTFASNEIDVMALYGGYASYVEIVTDDDIRVEFNGASDAVLDVAAGTETFDDGDLSVNLLRFDYTTSGAGTAHVQVLLTVRTLSAT